MLHYVKSCKFRTALFQCIDLLSHFLKQGCTDEKMDINNHIVKNLMSFPGYNSTKKIYFTKLFPKSSTVNYKNLSLSPSFVNCVTTERDSNEITKIIKGILVKNGVENPETVNLLDCTGGVGCDSIQFALNFNHVTTIEIDKDRFIQLEHNIEQYKLTNISTINGNSALLARSIQNVSVVYIDPPWGGSSYKDHEKLRLKFGDGELEDFAQSLFNDPDRTKSISLIVLKLPKNYDVDYLYSKLAPHTIYVHELFKINIFVVENANIGNPSCYQTNNITKCLDKINETDHKSSDELWLNGSEDF